MSHAFILLGSNMGNPVQNLHNARTFIAGNLGQIMAMSSVYQTAAWGNTQQADFLNQVIGIETQNSPDVLLQGLLKIEQDMGRNRNEKWEPRIIDLDILFFDSLILDIPELKIPHPYLHVRRFTLVPLHEIVPFLIHPVFNKSVSELLEACSDHSKVIKL